MFEESEPCGKTKGLVIWITGLSAAGKTTIANALLPCLPEKQVLLDGDDLRNALQSLGSKFDVDGRRQLAYAYAGLAKMLADQGAVVVVATIALFHEIHDWNRENMPGYFEIFLDVPEAIRRARDPKGLYAKAAAGRLKDVAGIDIVPEFPEKPDMHIKYDETRGVKDIVRQICLEVKPLLQVRQPLFLRDGLMTQRSVEGKCNE